MVSPGAGPTGPKGKDGTSPSGIIWLVSDMHGGQDSIPAYKPYPTLTEGKVKTQILKPTDIGLIEF